MKILVIGLDAATMDLVEPWAAAGHLPSIARLMSEGASSRLLSTPNMHSASAWTSILSGVNPGRHGLFVFSDRDYATGKQLFFKGGDRKCAIISQLLSGYGVSSGLLNVPMTYPAQCDARGFVISGLDAPSLNEQAFCPRELRGELFARFPDYRFTPTGLGDAMSSGRTGDALDSWLRLIEIQTTVAEWLMESRPVDFFMTVYTASDWGGHNLWRGPDVIEDSPELLSIYRALDAAVERLLAGTSEQTQVYLISDHGMGRHTGASYHLAAQLELWGYLVRGKKATATASLLSTGRRAARSLLPSAMKEKIKAGIGDERVKRLQSGEKDSFYESIDWERTSAYTEPGRHVININLAGRNQFGQVAKDDYERTCDRIIGDLMKWTDPSGCPVVEKVTRRDEVYFGTFAGQASDLYIHWNPEASFGEPPAEIRSRGYWWNGDHRPEGILICKGPGVRSGSIVEPPTVYDLVPTLMYGAGLPIPDGLDGRVIRELFTCDVAESTQSSAVASAQGEASDDALTESERQMIEDKLRSLGYL
jgi:predicted AlkP superfamily phosphohydrolase/phosphomutase